MLKEKTYIYFLKVFAIFLVIYNHTGAFNLFYTGKTSKFYFIYVFLSSFCKIAVPIFFMSSGALILGRDESLSTVVKNRVLRFAKILILFSFITYFFKLILNDALSTFSMTEFFRILYSDRVIVSYWYLYYYLGLMIMLPFIRKMAINMSNIEFKYLIGVFIGYNFITIMIKVLFDIHISGLLHVPIVTSNAIFYFMVGYYIDNRIKEETIRQLKYLHIVLISIFTTIFSSFIIIIENRGGESQVAHSLLIAIPTIMVFIFIKKFTIENQLSPHVISITKRLSGATLVIYLLEGILQMYFTPLYLWLAPRYTVIISSIIIIILVVFVGYMINYLLNKVSIIKKILL